MNNWFICVIVSLIMLALAGCGKTDSTATVTSASAGNGNATEQTQAQASASPAPTGSSLIKISQFGGSLYCSIATGADGTLHAIYTDRADPTKVMFLYYRSSKDGGATWSEPKNLSDDESGLSSYYCRCVVDGKGRAYAVWKYLTAASDSLDGPGSACCGIIAYRCLDGGTWSKTVRLCDKHVPATSYFAALGPDGAINVVWAQGNKDYDWDPHGGVSAQQANCIQQTVLNGAAIGSAKELITPKPVPTKQQIDAAHAAGHDIPYEDQYPKSDGLWDLRGYIDASGAAHFIGDHKEPYPNPDNVGPWIVYFDGKTQHKLFEYERGGGELNFNNPWTLLVDAHGKEHVIRSPQKSEKSCVRDYPIENGKLGEGVDVIAPEKAPGKIADWQATQLPNGKMVVTAALSQKGGWAPDDLELMVSESTGDGKWSKQVSVTNNSHQESSMSKGAISSSSTYFPQFAESTAMKDGIGILMVNTEHGVVGVNNAAVTESGRTVTALSSYSSNSPWVFFTKVKS